MDRLNQYTTAFIPQVAYRFLKEGSDQAGILLIASILTIKFGATATGQFIPVYLILQFILQLSLFGFHTHVQEHLQHDGDRFVVWNNAVKARTSILYLSVLTLLIIRFNSPFVIPAAVWLITRFYNEIISLSARYNDKTKEVLLIQWIFIVAVGVWINAESNSFSLTNFLTAMSIAECGRLAIQLLFRLTYFKLSIVPRIDFTQLYTAIPHLGTRLLYILPLNITLLAAILFLPSGQLTIYTLEICFLVLGTLPAFALWSTERYRPNALSIDAIVISSLRLTMPGTIISVLWILSTHFLINIITGRETEPWVIVPQFIMLLTVYYQLPWISAFQRLKETSSLRLLLSITLFIELTLSIVLLSQGDVLTNFMAISGLLFLNTIAIRLLANKIL
jgi:hypothetical protein